jgi:hypothetical protein
MPRSLRLRQLQQPRAMWLHPAAVPITAAKIPLCSTVRPPLALPAQWGLAGVAGSRQGAISWAMATATAALIMPQSAAAPQVPSSSSSSCRRLLLLLGPPVHCWLAPWPLLEAMCLAAGHRALGNSSSSSSSSRECYNLWPCSSTCGI